MRTRSADGGNVCMSAKRWVQMCEREWNRCGDRERYGAERGERWLVMGSRLWSMDQFRPMVAIEREWTQGVRWIATMARTAPAHRRR
ncbi:unnamed protein product [Nippostrongylus brasiliensis]|uniref:DUF4113 domain-containing protein n=1 Tax=Nippostrongylus brasiliensis TaxID=27835 RepID=A0A0N4YV17_NIPBR|nr:unnamed protein product [Nippostrongylus brasiliensis]